MYRGATDFVEITPGIFIFFRFLWRSANQSHRAWRDCWQQQAVQQEKFTSANFDPDGFQIHIFIHHQILFVSRSGLCYHAEGSCWPVVWNTPVILISYYFWNDPFTLVDDGLQHCSSAVCCNDPALDIIEDWRQLLTVLYCSYCSLLMSSLQLSR